MKWDLFHIGAKIDDNTLKHTIPEQMKRILSKSIASVDDCMFARCTGDEIHVVTKTPISICGIGTAILDHLLAPRSTPPSLKDNRCSSVNLAWPSVIRRNRFTPTSRKVWVVLVAGQ